MADPPARHPKPPPFLSVVSGAAPDPVDALPSPRVPSRPEHPMDLTSGVDRRDSTRRDALALAGLYEEHNPWVLKRLRRYGVRNPADRWGPRALDLDLLVYGDETLDEPGLCVPHPHLHERAFVLVPLAEIAPTLVIPGRGEVKALLAAVDVSGIEAIP